MEVSWIQSEKAFHELRAEGGNAPNNPSSIALGNYYRTLQSGGGVRSRLLMVVVFRAEEQQKYKKQVEILRPQWQHNVHEFFTMEITFKPRRQERSKQRTKCFNKERFVSGKE